MPKKQDQTDKEFKELKEATLKDLREQREIITNRWDKIGLLEGLDGHVKENVGKLFESELSWKINEGDDSKGFDEAFKNFPIKIKKAEIKKRKIKPNINMNQHQVEPEDYYHYVETEKLAKELMVFVIEKYNIKSLDDFTCEHHKALAKELGFFK